MKRRELFKMLGTLAATPVIAPFAAKLLRKPTEPERIKAALDEFASTDKSDHGATLSMVAYDIFESVEEPKRYFYSHSIEPSPAEKAIGITEKRIYGSSL